MSTASAAAGTLRRLDVARPALVIEGHPLSDVTLSGWAYGPDLGTAPVVVVVGGITASPFPLGDGRGEAGGGSDAVVAGALCARPRRRLAHDRALSLLARQRLDLARPR